MSEGRGDRPIRRSHGSGEVDPSRLGACGARVLFEPGVLIFHPENIFIGDDVYVGHRAILKGYHINRLVIGDGTWVGQDVFMHSAAGIEIGRDVGIGPRVMILTSQHQEPPLGVPIIRSPVEMAPVVVGDGADLGVGSILLPGVTVGQGAIVGAGAVVTRDVAPNTVVAGNPARFLRGRA